MLTAFITKETCLLFNVRESNCHSDYVEFMIYVNEIGYLTDPHGLIVQPTNMGTKPLYVFNELGKVEDCARNLCARYTELGQRPDVVIQQRSVSLVRSEWSRFGVL